MCNILRTMHLTILLSTILVFLTTCFILWKRRRFYYVSYKLKGPFALPFIGNLLDLRKYSEDILQKLIEWREKYGCPYRFWLGTKLFVYTSNPEDFKILFNSPDALNKKEIYDYYKPAAREGLLTCSDVSKWRQNRKLIAKMFNQRTLNGFTPIFQRNSLILYENLGKVAGKGSFDVHSWLNRCHLDVICETSTGIKVNAQQQERSEYMECYERICDIMYSRIFNVLLYFDFIYKRTTLGIEQEKLINYIRNFNKNMIHSKRKQHEQSPKDEYSEKREVFLDYFMETGQFTDEEVDTELYTLILAGIDTASTIESFTLMLLGMLQEVQDKVFDEQQKIFGVDQRETTYTDLSEMKYLERVIKESMRVFPVVAVFFRTITNDIELGTRTLPKGTTVVFGMLDAHRDQSIWEEPLKFDPDRFLPERIAKKHPYSYIPFSAGPRDCIGQKYGMILMKVILSTIVRKYKIYCEYKNVEDIKVTLHFTLKAKDGFRISLEHRH